MSWVALIRIELIDQLEIIAVVEFVRGEGTYSSPDLKSATGTMRMRVSWSV